MTDLTTTIKAALQAAHGEMICATWDKGRKVVCSAVAGKPCQCEAAWRTVEQAIEASGHRIVPAIPADEMVEAGLKADAYCSYESLLAAIAAGSGKPLPDPLPLPTITADEGRVPAGYDASHPLYAEVAGKCASCLFYIPDGEFDGMSWGDCIIKDIPGMEKITSLDEVSEDLPCNLFTVPSTHTCEKYEQHPVQLAIALRSRERAGR